MALSRARIHRVAATIGAALVTASLSAQTNMPGERFTAVAINMGEPGPTWTARVQLVVNRWSSNADRDRLWKSLFDGGPKRLLDTLQRMPRVGYFRTPNDIGYDLRFAQRTSLPDGGERATLLTDRWVSFSEAANQSRTLDYPFTAIEFEIKPNGTGEGTMTLATKITGDEASKLLFYENYGTQPVRLSDVRREK